jgi:hypothetical protein
MLPKLQRGVMLHNFCVRLTFGCRSLPSELKLRREATVLFSAVLLLGVEKHVC